MYKQVGLLNIILVNSSSHLLNINNVMASFPNYPSKIAIIITFLYSPYINYMMITTVSMSEQIIEQLSSMSF